jgi:hypothetical protein
VIANFKIKVLIVGAFVLGSTVSFFGQAPVGWESYPGLEKKLSGERKWFVFWRAEHALAAGVNMKEATLSISDLETLLRVVNSGNDMKILSRVVPTGLRYPCFGFIGSTRDNFPAELYVIITPEHVYSVFTMTMAGSLSSLQLPSKMALTWPIGTPQCPRIKNGTWPGEVRKRLEGHHSKAGPEPTSQRWRLVSRLMRVRKKTA